MYTTELIKKTFEEQMHMKTCLIHQFENTNNNYVFKIETRAKPYIFKVYSKSGWPEEGKLAFVDRKLNEYNIPHAKMLVFNLENQNFSYSIEECLPGTTADRLALTPEENLKLFEKLAYLVSRVHRIRLKGYGYTGSGTADYSTFSEFMYDVLKDNIPFLAKNGFDKTQLTEVNKAIYERLKCCDIFPPVLCHGDLSLKNILVNSNEITLIDWDDVHSLCWVADIARLTFWMKLNYDSNSAGAYRKAFLDCYETEYNKNIFYEIEDTLHVWNALDYLTFFTGTTTEAKLKLLLRELKEKCGV